MRFIDRLAARLGYLKRQPERAPAFLRDDAARRRWSVPDGSLYHAQADLYRRLSWVQIAVGMVARTAAGVAFRVQRRQGEELLDISNHPFEQLLSSPNPLHSRFELLEATVGFLRLCGNAYWFLNRDGPGEAPAEIWPVFPHQLLPIPDGQSYIRGYAFSPEGTFGDVWVSSPPFLLPTWSIVHFKSFNPLDPFVGASPVEPAATVATGDLHAQAWNAAFFGEDNAKLPGALSFADMINESTWTQIRADIKAQWGGTKRSGPMLLRGVGQAVNWIPMGLDHEKMQFLASRQFTKQELYDLFAPGLTSMLDPSATEASSKTGKAVFLEFAIWPLLCALAEKITNDILPVYDRRLRPGALVGSFADVRPTDRALAISEAAAATPFLLVDEIRKKYFGLGPLPGGAGARLAEGRDTGDKSVSHDGAHDGALPSARSHKAALLPTEAALLARLQGLGAAATLAAVEAVLAHAVTAAMAAAVAAAGVDATGAPVADWARDLVHQVAPDLAERLAVQDAGMDWFWLVRLVVRFLARAQVVALQRLAAWMQTTRHGEPAPPDTVLVWTALPDACPRCLSLDGMPADVWADADDRAGEGPPLHDFCRCQVRLVSLSAAQVATNGAGS